MRINQEPGDEFRVAVGSEMHDEDNYRCAPEEEYALEALAPLLFG